jgi:hypothetical protein
LKGDGMVGLSAGSEDSSKEINLLVPYLYNSG